MSDEQAPDPILTNDQSETKPGLPLLPPGKYKVKIVAIDQQRNSKDTGNLLVIQLGLLDEDVHAVTGELLKPGFPFFARIALTPTPNYTKESIDRAIKNLMLAAGVPDNAPGTGSAWPLDRFVGKVIPIECCKVTVSKETDEYAEGNQVRISAPRGVK